MDFPSVPIGNGSWRFERVRNAPPHPQIGSTAPSALSIVDSSSLPSDKRRFEIQQTAPAAECLPKTCVAPCVRGLFTFEYFNKMQSKCFPALYDGNDNCVIGAPTAAGKTICFELALAAFFARLLRPPQVNQSSSSSNIATTVTPLNQANANGPTAHSFTKALYLAPLKSLVQERLKDWTKKLQPLGITCQELSGDNMDELTKDCDLYLATPEKWDAITRRWKDHAETLEKIGLILIDEVHLLGDDRGPVLEAVIARCLSLSHPGRAPRIVALSASSPNVGDIGKWIRAPQENVFFFGDEHRPITPKLHVLGYSPSKNDFLFERALDFKLWGVIAQYSEQKPTLVFCSSRKSTIAAASKLLEMCSQNNSTYVRSNDQRERLFTAAKLVQNDPQLSACILSGIAYHHAGMSSENRALVEKLFTSGEDVMVVTATSTLAVGVNLPAYLVIIKNTSYWTQANGVEECSPIQIRQMIGRAGRPGFGDTRAVAVIMTQLPKVSTYESILECDVAITESNLHKHLTDTLLNEIVVGSVTTFRTALLYLQRTFLSVRIHANPQYYLEQLENSTTNAQNAPTVVPSFPTPLDTSMLHPMLRSMCLAALAALTKYECIVVQEHNTLVATDLGRCLSRWFVTFKSLKAIFDFFPPTVTSGTEETEKEVTTRSILECISSSPQFDDIIVRRAEKKELKDFSSRSRFPVEKGIFKAEKVMILVQSSVLGVFSDSSLRAEAQSCTSTAISLCSCLAQFFLDRQWFYALHKALLLQKSLRKLCWVHTGPQTSQIPIINREMAAKLQASGYRTLLDLTTATQEAIQAILRIQPAFARNIFLRLQQIPAYSLMVQVDRTRTSTVLKFEAHGITTGKTGDKFEHRWAVLGQNGKVLTHRMIPLGNTNSDSVTFSMTLDSNVVGEVEFFFVSDEWIGFDVVGCISLESTGYQHLAIQTEYQDPYAEREGAQKTKKRKRLAVKVSEEAEHGESLQICQHKCKNKFTCKHECCKSHPDVKASGKVRVELPTVLPRVTAAEREVGGNNVTTKMAPTIIRARQRDEEDDDLEPRAKRNFSPLMRTSAHSHPASSIFQRNAGSSDYSMRPSQIPLPAPVAPKKALDNISVSVSPMNDPSHVITTRPGDRGAHFTRHTENLETPSNGKGSNLTNTFSAPSSHSQRIPPSTNLPAPASQQQLKARIPTLKNGPKRASEVRGSHHNLHSMNTAPQVVLHPSGPSNMPYTPSNIAQQRIHQHRELQTAAMAHQPQHRPSAQAAPSFPAPTPYRQPQHHHIQHSPPYAPTPLAHPTPKRAQAVTPTQPPFTKHPSAWSSLLNWELDSNSFAAEEP